MSPKISKQHIIDQSGIQVIEKFFLEKGWIVRRQDKDYGIDLEVEIATTSGIVTGKIFKIQGKSHEDIKFNNSLFTEYIPLEYAGYWESIDLPVFLFVIDISREKIYWANVVTGARSSFKKGQKSIPYRIREQSDLANQVSFEEFSYSINHFLEIKKFKENVLFILKKFDSFLMLYERIHCSDSFLSIDRIYADALKLHFEYVIGFPNYMLNKEYEMIYNAFKRLTQQIDIDLIEFYQAIPICDTVFQYYYKIIAFILLTVLGLEHEYWEKIDSSFYEMVKNLKIPKSNSEEDVLKFFVDNYEENNQIFV